MNRSTTRVVVTDPTMTHVGWIGEVIRRNDEGHLFIKFNGQDPQFNNGILPFSLWYEPNQVQTLIATIKEV